MQEIQVLAETPASIRTSCQVPEQLSPQSYTALSIDKQTKEGEIVGHSVRTVSANWCPKSLQSPEIFVRIYLDNGLNEILDFKELLPKLPRLSLRAPPRLSPDVT